MSFVCPFVHQSIPLFALVFSAKYLSKCTSAVWVLVRQYVYLHVCYSTSSPFNIFNSLRKLRKSEIKNHVLLPCVITQQFLSPSLRIWSVNYIFCHPFIPSCLSVQVQMSQMHVLSWNALILLIMVALWLMLSVLLLRMLCNRGFMFMFVLCLWLLGITLRIFVIITAYFLHVYLRFM